MAWFLNQYECEECGETWEDEWSCMCDDDCPHCGARHMETCSSVDLTEVIEAVGDSFLVLRSSVNAESEPDYRILVEFPTREEAERFLQRCQEGEPG